MTDSSMAVIGDVPRREIGEILQLSVVVNAQTINESEKQKPGMTKDWQE